MKIILSLVLIGICGCASRKPGILLMAHGGDDAWNGAVETTVAPLRSKYPTEIAFGMARSSTIRNAVQRLEEQGVRRIAVVRMFISADSFLERTEDILGLGDAPPEVQRASGHAQHETHEESSGSHQMEAPERISAKSSFVLSRAGVAESSLIDEILVDRVRALSTDPGRESVLILAHGPGDEAENERWLAHMRQRAQRIHEIGPFRHVECETLREDWSGRRAEAERRIRQYVESAARDGGRVIVVPFRVAGFGPYKKVLAGLNYVADGRGFCPHSHMTQWIEQTARACFGDQ